MFPFVCKKKWKIKRYMDGGVYKIKTIGEYFIFYRVCFFGYKLSLYFYF